MCAKAILGLALCLGIGRAGIVDRIAVIVDGQAIKQSDIQTEVRVTDFLNHAKLDLSLAAQKEAVNRLIDQKLIRKAMENGIYPVPAPEEAEPLLEQIRKRYPDDAAYRRALASYGIDEAVLREHLLWQITVLRFLSLRFPPAAATEAAANEEEPNQQFFAWLDQSRKDTRIEFKQEDLK